MTINFLVIGGSGHWSELNHYPSLLALEKEGINARVVGICDPTDPYSVDAAHYKVGRKNLISILKRDTPVWINPKQFQSQHKLTDHLEQIVREHNVTIVIIATNPTEHYFYAQWAAEQSLNVLCDKPLIVVPDASWKPEKAEEIEYRFNNLLQKVTDNQRVNPNYSFCTPLRRRALTPFVKIADSLHQVYEQTGQGVTYINAMVNGGIHRYPAEFTKGGAHGFLDGVGSLSHTSYHYLDVLAWYLQSAPGNVKRIGVSAVYINRVKDYLAAQGYRPLISTQWGGSCYGSWRDRPSPECP